MSAQTSTTIYLKDYKPVPFIVDSVHLYFDLHEDFTRVKSLLKMTRRDQNSTESLQLNGTDLELKHVHLDGRELSSTEFQVTDEFLIINKVPNEFTLEIEVLIKPQENKALMGLYQSRGNFCTQCESHGFRRITYFFDRPDVMTRFTTTITADKSRYPYLLSNGNLLEKRDLDHNRHWVHWEDSSKKPCYLFALVAGDFDLLIDEFTTMSGRKVDLQLYLEKGFADQGAYALESLKNAMSWDEKRWGREYDLDIYMIVAVSDFNMGAMENKGLNVFNTKYILAKPDTATDMDYVNIEAVIGHEYFHNWSGNRVTCRDWFQITLKEGLTVFRDQLFTEDMTSKAVSRLDSVDVVRTRQFSEDSGPLAHPIRPDSYMEINNFYTVTVYRKGAEVIRMVQTLLGEELFRKGLDLYFARYDEQAVTTEDFISCFEEVSKRDFTQFKRWYSQVGTPALNVRTHYDAEGKAYTISIKQEDALCIPFSVGLVDPKGEDMPLELAGSKQEKKKTFVLEVTKDQEQFTFINVNQEPVPSFLRNFSAPVKLHYDYSNDDLAHLWKYDCDAFSRWDAGQQFATRIVLQLLGSSEDQWELPATFIDCFGHILQSEMSDKRFLARLLTLPSEAFLQLQVSKINPHMIHAARNFIVLELNKIFHRQFLSIYKQWHTNAAYVYNNDAVGERSLKNVCLRYLTSTQSKESIDLAYQQFLDANNMTDRMGALWALNDCDSPLRTKALDIFYDHYKHEPLVVNKWLGLQAMSNMPNTYENVVKLMTHQAFDLRNPNNVYALLNAFADSSLAFHDKDAQAYAFIAEQVDAIDRFNPQVAGRLIQPLTQWKRYQSPYSELMHAQLKKMLEKRNDYSRDIHELLHKSV